MTKSELIALISKKSEITQVQPKRKGPPPPDRGGSGHKGPQGRQVQAGQGCEGVCELK